MIENVIEIFQVETPPRKKNFIAHFRIRTSIPFH